MPPKAITSYFKPAAPAAAPLSSTRRTKATLSNAARAAILSSADAEPSPSKRAKLSTAAPVDGTSLARAESRDDLRKVLEAHPGTAKLLQLELDTLGEDWLLALQDELTKPYFLKLKQYVMSEQETKKVFPPAEDIYSWSRLCPLKDVRIIVVGQDPYHDDGQAHGLAFSVKKGVKIPPSLRNIYKQMATEVPGFVTPTHGDLTEWAKHGVLLLNTSLTVRAHQAGSHANQGWEQFTAAVLRVVTDRLASADETPGANGVVIMAWGAHAAKMIAGLNTKRHHVLKSAHPSPLSASRGFFGNNHFTKANEWLQERYTVEGVIDWKSLGA
ncbi:uracil-DNA glycosylase [Cutaneotrichosporon oleaginosum]|uniref:Uracil-DNA glycosylase n=1 Tax=Cutaneotrichosporon oleaginosum TaxID=879819 RepID=A0A0J1BAH4_9TREE|nr:uracil-DNA glycosylase [Cutaneotrichosporon oleaginosum]KLT44904.1 uracil-DNA glycosylase [Cutaneotrichosporon oleaginosum]TXT12033.1 hypothetical protein COLE_02443 [Cutaneotrichosporon oleaginosum]